MDNPWTFHGWSMDNPWISMDKPKISRNPFRHQTARHWSWEDFAQTNLDDFSARVFANFEISRFPLFIFLNFYGFFIMLGGTVDHQGSVWRQLGPPRTILEVFCLSATFPEIPKSWKFDFWVFPVTVFDEIPGNRCGIDVRSFSNPRFIKNDMWGRFFHGWGLAGVIGIRLLSWPEQ